MRKFFGQWGFELISLYMQRIERLFLCHLNLALQLYSLIFKVHYQSERFVSKSTRLFLPRRLSVWVCSLHLLFWWMSTTWIKPSLMPHTGCSSKIFRPFTNPVWVQFRTTYHLEKTLVQEETFSQKLSLQATPIVA